MGFTIVVEGNIGSGKSTILREFKRIGFVVGLQPIEKWSLLPSFYQDKERFAFPLQEQVLASYRERHDGIYKESKAQVVILESCSHSSLFTFGAMLNNDKILTNDQMSTLKGQDHESFPDVFIYVDTPPKTCLKRIKERNRECESNMDLSYLQHWNDTALDYIKNHEHKDRIVVFDNEKHNNHREIVEAVVKRFLMKKMVSIEGVPGSGKTTLGRLLSSKWNWLEQIITTRIQELLEKRIKTGSVLELQKEFTIESARQLHAKDTTRVVISEGILSIVPVYSHSAVLSNELPFEDLQDIYLDYQDYLLPTLDTFQLVFYLRPPIEEIMKRIEKRARPGEDGYSKEYILLLQGCYDKLFKRATNVLFIDNSKLSQDEIIDMITEKLTKMK